MDEGGEYKNIYLPANRVELGDVFSHILINVKSVDHRIEFESHLVVLTPPPYFVQVINVAFLALGTTNGLVGGFIKAVTGDGKNVQVLSL